jgi:hypothetical protein
LAYNNSPLLFVVRPAKSAMAVSLSTDWVLTLHIDTHLLKETGDHLLPHVRTTMMTTMMTAVMSHVMSLSTPSAVFFFFWLWLWYRLGLRLLLL